MLSLFSKQYSKYKINYLYFTENFINLFKILKLLLYFLCHNLSKKLPQQYTKTRQCPKHHVFKYSYWGKYSYYRHKKHIILKLRCRPFFWCIIYAISTSNYRYTKLIALFTEHPSYHSNVISPCVCYQYAWGKWYLGFIKVWYLLFLNKVY